MLGGRPKLFNQNVLVNVNDRLRCRRLLTKKAQQILPRQQLIGEEFDQK